MGNEELHAKAKKLEEWLAASIKYVDGQTKKNMARATTIRIATLFSSGLATVFLGLKLSSEIQSVLVNIAFSLSAIVTFLNAMEPFFNFRSLWVAHEFSEARFNRIYDNLRFYMEGKEEDSIKETEISNYYSQYQQAWAELNDAWSTERKKGEIEFKGKSKIGTTNK